MRPNSECVGLSCAIGAVLTADASTIPSTLPPRLVRPCKIAFAFHTALGKAFTCSPNACRLPRLS